MRYSIKIITFRRTSSILATRLEPLHVRFLLLGVLAAQQIIPAWVPPKLPHNLMVRQELIQAILQQSNMFLVARHTFALYLIVLDFRLDQTYSQLVVFFVL